MSQQDIYALEAENEKLRAQIDAIWDLIKENDIHSWYVPSMCVAEALGGKLVKGKWEKP